MTFPFCMKTTSKGLLHRQPYMEEKATAGTDSAKINLRAVSYRCEYLSCSNCNTHSNLQHTNSAIVYNKYIVVDSSWILLVKSATG